MTRADAPTSERLTYRDLHRSDLPAFLNWRNDPDVSESLSSLTVSATELDLWFDRQERNSNAAFFALENSGELIGYVGLRDIDWAERNATLDIMIGRKDMWDQGFGTEATEAIVRYGFEELDLDRIELTVLPFNERGIRCYEKCGFKRCGFINQNYRRRDRVWQPLRMTLTPMQFALARKAWLHDN